jgi:hypothetical protein
VQTSDTNFTNSHEIKRKAAEKDSRKARVIISYNSFLLVSHRPFRLVLVFDQASSRQPSAFISADQRLKPWGPPKVNR